MKYAVVLYDGMADYPVPTLGGKTPMELAFVYIYSYALCYRVVKLVVSY